MNIAHPKHSKLHAHSPGDLTGKAPADRSRINVRDPRELKYWCHLLEVTPERLKRASVLAGVMLTDVKTYLHRASFN